MPFKIAIVGRPNVGKSSLFNRIVGSRLSITDDKAGITRDRIYAQAEWLTKTFRVIDTGGIDIIDAPFLELIKAQAMLAMDEADLIVFVVDGKIGLTEVDNEIAKMLYQTNKEIIVVVNKIDNLEMKNEIYEFYSLGFGDPMPVSSLHGIGMGDLLDKIASQIPDDKSTTLADSITFALIGRPNVGKSSLTNAILGQNRVIVSPISGTTTDSIDTEFINDGTGYVVIDTAGIKKRGKIYENADKYSLLRAMLALERADVALLLLDATEGIVEQDKNVFGYAMDQNKALIIVVNKWDAIHKETKTMNEWTIKIREEFKFALYAPIVFVSAKNEERINTIFPQIKLAHTNYTKEIQTSILNEILSDSVALNPPALFNGNMARFNYMTQVSIKPPTFLLFVNEPEYVHFSYQRYLHNQFRSIIDFAGTPIK